MRNSDISKNISGYIGNDNGGWDYFLVMTNIGSLIISSTTGNKISIGPSGWKSLTSKASYTPETDLSAIGKWAVLTVGWYVDKGPNGSQVWVNGNFMCNFQARTSPGSSQLAIGDAGIAGQLGMKGDIGYITIYKDIIPEKLIVKFHKSLMKKFGIISSV